MTNHNKVLSCYLQFKTNKVICSNFPKKKKKPNKQTIKTQVSVIIQFLNI